MAGSPVPRGGYREDLMATKRGAIDTKTLASFRKSLEERPEYRVARNAASRGNLEEVSLNRAVIDKLDWNFSHEVAVGGITAQNNAGTCWLYAGLNWLRKRAMKKMKVKEFQFSQNYLVFWDRLEKANQFLERILRTLDRPLDDRYVVHLLEKPLSDGGEWIRLSDLVEKYGLVPRSVMNDTANLENSAFLNYTLHYKLREAAARLRELHAAGAKEARLQEFKEGTLGMVYRSLVILLGEPPRKFDFGFKTKKGKVVRETGITPQEFFTRWVDLDLSDYLHLVSSPLESTPYYRPYRFEFSPNLVGMPLASSLNVPIDTVRDLSRQLLVDGKAVLFDCDVTQGLNRKLGALDTELYDYGALLGTEFTWDRAGRMKYLHQRPTHCMVLVGVDLVDDRPVKWKIENSWGDESGHKGVFQMSDRWFTEYVYGITVHRKVLGKKLTKAFEKEPVLLPPWHTLS